jgi:uncharacterized membrane protein
MNKTRLEALSDGVFAIVLTLLVLDLHVPHLEEPFTNAQLWSQLALLWPVFGSFLLSFLVISVFWINHHFLFTFFVNKIDRSINLLNIVYLLFVVLVPFSANLFGEYPESQLAAVIYGVNILACVALLRMMILVAQRTVTDQNTVSPRTMKQARIRANLTNGSYLLGIAAAFVYIPASVFFYIFPMVFNMIPGTLDFFERIFRFEIA